jgi:hypothetical protein
LRQETQTFRKRGKTLDRGFVVPSAFQPGASMTSNLSVTQGPLHHFVGSWQGEVDVDGSAVEAHRYTQQNTFVWTLGGLFLEERGIGSNGSAFLGLWSLDRQTGRYRAHYFLAPSGDVVALTHEWQESSRTLVGSAELGQGMRMLAQDRFIDSDLYEWSIRVEDSAGTVLTRMRGRERRVAP